MNTNENKPSLFNSRTQAIKTYSRHVSAGKVSFYSRYNMTFVPGKREGAFIYDVSGKKYLNCHCNGGVYNLGHRNKEIIDTLKHALDNYDIGNHHLISEPKAKLGQVFANLMPGDINQVVFGVGGGEAVDLAIKLARGYTGRRGVISAKGGYHGHTGFALATGDPSFRAPFGPLAPGFIQVPFNDTKQLELAMNDDIAAVIFETIPATLGMAMPDQDFFEKVREICDKYGALLILDEIQTGLGRTGQLWGFQHYDIIPDIVVLGKGLSGGIYPMSATCYRDELDKFFMKHPFIHVSTFGGSELGCFTTMKVLEIVSSKSFLEAVNEKAKYLNDGFRNLQSKFPDELVEIRQKGLFTGLKFKSPEYSMLICKALFENGMYAIYSGNDKTVVQILPPLIASIDELNMLLDILEKSMFAVSHKFKYRFLSSLLKRFNKEPV